MNQLNLQVPHEFEVNLSLFMKARGFISKSDAIAIAVRESLERLNQNPQYTDFTQWIGCGKRAAENPAPRFFTDDDLWR